MKHKRAALAIILLSYAIIVIDISIAITGLPSIQHDFHLSTAHLSWVQNAYALVFGGLLLLGARAGDIFGRRKTFVLGLMLFAASSLFIGLSVNGAMLIAFRATQGIGAALLAPSTLALLSLTFPSGHERTRAFGAYAAVAGAAATIGLVLGGLFAGYLNWRVGFFINPPIATILTILAKKYIPETLPSPSRFDFTGAVLSTIGMSLIVFSLVESTVSSSGVNKTIWLAPIGLVLLLFFILHERRADQPILPLRIFKSRERSGALISRLFFLGAMAPFWFFTSQFLQLVLGFTPEAAGMAFLPTTLVNFASAWFAPKFMIRFGNMRVLLFGLTTCTIGMFWLSQIDSRSTYALGIVGPMLLLGFGQGFSLAPLTAAGVASIQPEDSGAASGAVNVAHQLGGSIGLAVEIFLSALIVHSTGAVVTRSLLATRISAAFTVGAVLLLLSLAAGYLAERGRSLSMTLPAWRSFLLKCTGPFLSIFA